MIVDYEPEHLMSIRPQRWQNGSNQTWQEAQDLKRGHCAYTALCHETQQPLVCAGIVEIWPGRALCWATFDYAARPVMLEAHRRTRLELDRAPFKRLEMYVAPGFVHGWRWAEMLGFELECCMENGAPDGRDLHVFKRIRHGRVAEELG